MKNAVPKNDKKKRKQLTEEIAKLEADLNQKHEEEFSQLQSTADIKVEAKISWLCIRIFNYEIALKCTIFNAIHVWFFLGQNNWSKSSTLKTHLILFN